MLQTCSRTRRGLWLLALFLTTAVGFATYRHSAFAVWNDSPCVFHPPDADEPNPHWAAAHDLSQPSALSDLWTGGGGAFQSVQGGGYRPLSELWTFVAAYFFYDPRCLPYPLLLVVGALHGALAVSLFAVARRFVRRDLTALGVVLLVLASPPLVASSWVCVAGVQVLVPLLFCISLLCYWNVVENRFRIPFGIVLVLLLFLGPWVREFFGLNALLLILLEWRRVRRPTWLMGVAALGFLHALFPTALVHWLCLPGLPLQPVYRLGTLAGALGKDEIRWEAAWHFLPLLPPLLWVCGGAEAVARFFDRSQASLNQKDTWSDRIERGIQRAALPCWLVLLFVVVVAPQLRGYTGVALCLGLAALGLRRDLFLGCWFLLTFVPILRVFTEHVHFLYAMPPAALILAQAAESLWLRLEGRPGLVRVRYALAGVLAVVGTDQALNVYGSYCVNHAAYEGIDTTADWFRGHVPEGSVVVSNVIHGEEIKWRSGNHVRNYWTIGAGINDPRRAVEQPAELEALLARAGPHPVYFLDVDFDNPPCKAQYHRHKYVHQLDIARHDLGIVHMTAARYLFVDPLRYLVPREFQPFLGAPDLVNDFGRRLSPGRPFVQEVVAQYHVYEVLDRKREDAEGSAVAGAGLKAP